MSPLSNATTLANYASGIGTQGATLEIDSNNKRVGIGTTNPQGPEGSLQVGTAVTISGNSGIVSATTFHGDFGSSTSVAGDLTVSGVITYEDVTNIDSIGIMTARSDLSIADKIIHTGDTNTSIRFPAADTVTVETGGNEAMRIDSSGRFGIGESTPLGKLHVKTADSGIASVGSSADDLVIESDTNAGITLVSNTENAINFADSSDVNVGQIAYNHSSDYLSFRVNDSERLRITSGGEYEFRNASTTVLKSVDTSGSSATDYGQFQFIGIRGVDNDSNTYMTIDSSGNMGLGTVSPSSLLNISSSTNNSSVEPKNDTNGLRITNSSASTGSYTNICLEPYAGDVAFIRAIANGNNDIDLDFGIQYSGQSSATSRMRIDSSGRLLVGTSTDTTARLVVKGSAGSGDDGINVISGSTTAGSKAAIFFSPSTTGSFSTGSAIKAERLSPDGSDLQFYTCTALGSAPTEKMRIDKSGRMGLGATSLTRNLTVQDSSTIVAAALVSNPSNIAYLLFGDTDSDAQGRVQYDNSLDALQLYSNGSERMRIDSSGQLAIGTATALSSSGYTGITASGSTGGIYWFAKAGAQKGYLYGQDNDVTLASTDTSGVIRLLTGGNNERLRVDSNGRLLLNTTDATNAHADADDFVIGRTNKADSGITIVSSTAGNGTINFSDGASSQAQGQIQYYQGYDYMSFDTFGSESMRIDSSGRLLIGQTTSPSAGSGQYAKLASVGNTALATGDGRIMLARGKTSATMSAGNDVGGVEFTDNTGASFAAVRAQVDGTPGGVNGNPGALLFCTEEVGSDNGAAEKMRIDNNGRMMIGTTDRGQGSADKLTIGDGSTDTGITIRSSSSTTGNLFFSNTTGFGSSSYRGYIQYQHSANRMYFGTSSVGKLLIGQYGFIHASNTADFSGDLASTNSFHSFASNIAQWTTQVKNSNSNPYGTYFYHVYAANDTGHQFIYCGDGIARRMEVRSNGGIANYSGNNANLCDEREKKNIVSLDTKWDKVKSWELKKFHYNEDADTDDLRYGVIAQQVEEHCPEVLTEWEKQSAAEAELDEDGNVVTPAREQIMRKGVKEQQMMWMAIKALQEAQTRIETLETQNADLLARVTALEG